LKKENIDVWSIDEVHFQQYGSSCRMWIPPEEKDPILKHHPGRKSVGYFGAVRIRDGKFVYRREENMFDGESFFSFLKYLKSKSTRAGRKVILLIDNAKYHHARLHKDWRAEVDRVFHCEYLPPYSPDLNPIERVWKLTRRMSIHNKYFATLTDIIVAVEKPFAIWEKPNDALRSLCKL
jgi:transposase